MAKEVSYLCYTCKKNSSKQNLLKTYCRVSSLESSFVCAECLTPFSSGYEATDKERSTYTCKECPKVFNSKNGLKAHSYQHSKAWPFVCQECGKGVSTSFHLKVHKNKHSKDRLHKCGICGSTFKYKFNLTSHMKTHAEQNPVCL